MLLGVVDADAGDPAATPPAVLPFFGVDGPPSLCMKDFDRVTDSDPLACPSGTPLFGDALELLTAAAAAAAAASGFFLVGVVVPVTLSCTVPAGFATAWSVGSTGPIPLPLIVVSDVMSLLVVSDVMPLVVESPVVMPAAGEIPGTEPVTLSYTVS